MRSAHVKGHFILKVVGLLTTGEAKGGIRFSLHSVIQLEWLNMEQPPFPGWNTYIPLQPHTSLTLFGSFGYAKMSLYDHHLSLLLSLVLLMLVLSALLASVSVDSSLSVKDICYYSKFFLHRNFFHIKCIWGSDWLQC